MTSHPFPVLLFYKYTPIADPAALVMEQRQLCESLHLKGRLLIAAEGINGTLAGAARDAEQYCAAMRRDERFADLEFKISAGSPGTFPKLVIKARREIVTLNLQDDVKVDPQRRNHLTPAQWKEMIERGDQDVVLLDVRNRFESEAGRFAGAIAPPIEHFRDLPAHLAQLSHLKEKKVMMYCTGGIRCEKAAALFAREGFRDVYQLHGGILAYHEQVGPAHWQGDCFVFDQRMSIPLDAAPVGKCAHTGQPTREFINCLHDPCHRLFLVAPEALAADSQLRLCPECLARGLTEATADYVGSPARG